MPWQTQFAEVPGRGIHPAQSNEERLAYRPPQKAPPAPYLSRPEGQKPPECFMGLAVDTASARASESRGNWIRRWGSEKSILWGGELPGPPGGKSVALRNISFLGHEYNRDTFRGQHYADTIEERQEEYARTRGGPAPPPGTRTRDPSVPFGDSGLATSCKTGRPILDTWQVWMEQPRTRWR